MSQQRYYILKHLKTLLIHNYCRFFVTFPIVPLPRLSNVNWLNSNNKHCYSMPISNYSILLIRGQIIAGLSRYTDIWKRYFQPLSPINCSIDGTAYKILYNNVMIYFHHLFSFTNSYHDTDGRNISGSNVRSSKSVSASNICLGKSIFSNKARLSRPIFKNNFFQRKSTPVLMSFQVNLFTLSILVLFIHHY